MLDGLRRGSSFANVVSVVALFVALGGTAWAIGANTVGSKQLKPSAVKGADISKDAVTASKVKNGSLLGEDFAVGQLPAGARGPEGQQGPAGPRGLEGARGLEGPPGPSTGPAGGVLGGSYPNPGFAADVNELVPIAAVTFAGVTGMIINQARRAPVSGNLTVTRSGTGSYRVDLPGVEYAFDEFVTVCTPAGSGSATLDTSNDTGDLLVRAYNPSTGAAKDVQVISCTISDV